MVMMKDMWAVFALWNPRRHHESHLECWYFCSISEVLWPSEGLTNQKHKTLEEQCSQEDSCVCVGTLQKAHRHSLSWGSDTKRRLVYPAGIHVNMDKVSLAMDKPSVIIWNSYWLITSLYSHLTLKLLSSGTNLSSCIFYSDSSDVNADFWVHHHLSHSHLERFQSLSFHFCCMA